MVQRQTGKHRCVKTIWNCVNILTSSEICVNQNLNSSVCRVMRHCFNKFYIKIELHRRNVSDGFTEACFGGKASEGQEKQISEKLRKSYQYLLNYVSVFEVAVKRWQEATKLRSDLIEKEKSLITKKTKKILILRFGIVIKSRGTLPDLINDTAKDAVHQCSHRQECSLSHTLTTAWLVLFTEITNRRCPPVHPSSGM